LIVFFSSSRTKHRLDVSANAICNTYFITEREI